jgi:hypothetical protein
MTCKLSAMGFLKKLFDSWRYKPQSKPYTFLYGLSDILVDDAPNNIKAKAQIEGIILLGTYLDMKLEKKPFHKIVIIEAIIKEMGIHSRFLQYQCDEEYIIRRMKLFRNEIIKTYITNDEGTYVGGILTYCVFKNPLAGNVERSLDMKLNLLLIKILELIFIEIDQYVDSLK